MSGTSSKQVVTGEPIGWIVLRRRGGWNVEPEIVRFAEAEGEAFTWAYMPEMCGYDPPADAADVFTYHAVMPCPFPSRPYEVRDGLSSEASKDLLASLRPSTLSLL